MPSLTARRNLEIAIKRSRFRGWTIAECCEIFSALPYLLERDCENLSGGELQMVSISRALVGSPGLVLLDEPSQGLAPRVVQDVLRTVQRLKQEGVAVVIVEQNVGAALDGRRSRRGARPRHRGLQRQRPGPARRRRDARAAAGGLRA